MEKGVSHDCLVPAHTQTSLWFELKQLVNQRLQVGIDKASWPLKLASQDFIEDDHFGAAEKGRLAAGHLVDYDTKGPKV